MTTVTVTAADGWKEVSTTSCDFENKSKSEADFITNAGQPGDTELGFDFPQGKREKVYLPTGETLWVLNRNATDVQIVVKAL